MQTITRQQGNFAVEPHTVIHEVNLAIDVQVIERFDEWLDKYTEEMLATPSFFSVATLVPDVDDENIKHRCVQFRVSDKFALNSYLEHHAEEMRAKGQEIFKGRFTAERRVLSVAEAALENHGVCANCNAELLGRFCSVCGQREESRVPTLGRVTSEFAHDLIGVESKLWNSFRLLLFKPGHLTTVYLSGKRQKYMSPVRLYLLFSIATFACFSLLNNFGGIDLEFQNGANSGAGANIEASEILTPLAEVEKASDEADVFTGKVEGVDLFSDELNEQIEQSINTTISSIRKDVEAGNKEAVFSKFLEPLPTALFLFLPIVALLFKILYLGSGRYYVEHLIYVLHNHAFLFAVIIFTTFVSQTVELWPQSDIFIALAWLFIFAIYVYPRLRKFMREKYAKSRVKTFLLLAVMLTILAALINMILSEGVGVLVGLLWVFYVPFYIYRSMRIVYERSRWVTTASLILISAMYLGLLIIMLLASAVFVGYTYN